MRRLAILISGRGSNMEALIRACAEPDFPAEIALVLSNRDDAAGLAKAQESGLETRVINHKAFADRAGFDAAVGEALEDTGTDLVCLAGFMRIFSAAFSAAWAGRMLNIHPSLLPAFPGLNVQQAAIDAGVRLSGCTVHYVTADLDAGPIIGQAAVPVWPDDTAQALSARILDMEHKLYPACVRLVAEGKVTYEEGRARFSVPDAAPILLPDCAA